MDRQSKGWTGPRGGRQEVGVVVALSSLCPDATSLSGLAPCGCASWSRRALCCDCFGAAAPVPAVVTSAVAMVAKNNFSQKASAGVAGGEDLSVLHSRCWTFVTRAVSSRTSEMPNTSRLR